MQEAATYLWLLLALLHSCFVCCFCFAFPCIGCLENLVSNYFTDFISKRLDHLFIHIRGILVIQARKMDTHNHCSSGSVLLLFRILFCIIIQIFTKIRLIQFRIKIMFTLNPNKTITFRYNGNINWATYTFKIWCYSSFQ